MSCSTSEYNETAKSSQGLNGSYKDCNSVILLAEIGQNVSGTVTS